MNTISIASVRTIVIRNKKLSNLKIRSVSDLIGSKNHFTIFTDSSFVTVATFAIFAFFISSGVCASMVIIIGYSDVFSNSLNLCFNFSSLGLIIIWQ